MLDGNQRAALAAVRSLGSKSLWAAVGESTTTSLAGASRYCSRRLQYPDPYSSPREFFDAVLLLISQERITFLLPITEATTYILMKYRSELPESVILPFPCSAAVESLSNKNELFELAERLEIPIPQTIVCRNAEQGLLALESINHFPIVIKPFKSKILTEGSITSTHVIIAGSKEEASLALQTNSFFNFPFTLQTFVSGHGGGVFALFNKGKPVCFFAHRRLREKPPGGGVSVLSESSPIDESLRAAAERLLKSANWHGVAMVEFRISADGIGYLMEVNPRFWGSLQLAIDSGVDFPWLLFQICTGQRTSKVIWKPCRLRWLLGDLDRLYLILKAPRSTYSMRRKILEILRFLKPGRFTRHEVNRWGDIGPAWYELRQYIAALKN